MTGHLKKSINELSFS